MHRQATLFGWFFLILGMASMAHGIEILLRGAFHAEGASCKAICGISLLVSQFLSPTSGAIAAGVLLVLVGSCMAFVGYRVLRER